MQLQTAFVILTHTVLGLSTPKPLMHVCSGFQRTKAEVVRVVHVGVSTIATRLREFTGTDSSALTYAQLKVQFLAPDGND